MLGSLPRLQSLAIYQLDSGYIQALKPLLRKLHERPLGGLKELKLVDVSLYRLYKLYTETLF